MGIVRTADLPLVYDVGMNNGDDSAYYLRKGLRVVGIDANPAICSYCTERFADDIARGAMTILNVAAGDIEGRATFYVNSDKHTISTFHPHEFDCQEWAPKNWMPVDVEVTRLSTLIARYGAPHFIKIDVEFHDKVVLRDLLHAGIRPRYISAEAHEVDVYDLLVEMGYDRFKFVRGAEVQERFHDTSIARVDGTEVGYSFPWDASGPFGDDLPGDWLDKDAALETLLALGLDWIDIHASFDAG